jgi:hydroxymethylglutaryl-CoA synthase
MRVCYHVPFCKMARKAHLQVRRSELEDSGGTWDPAAEQAGIASFKTQVEPSLPLCARVGNIYTGSLYLGLTGLLHAQAQDLAGARIGLFSYGSGCTSEFFSGVVGKHAAARIAAAKLGEMLDAREKISVIDYERIMALPPSAPMDGAATSAGFRFLGVTDHRRQYAGR